MTERLRGRPSTTLPISLSTLGKRSPKKARTFAKVIAGSIMYSIELLEKNRHKRPSLEEVLNHPWFGEFKDIQKMRNNSDQKSRFEAYALCEPNSPKLKEEMEKYK
jgi:hypothetical protein